MGDLSHNMLIIRLNINGQNSAVKRQKLTECMKKHDPGILTH